MNSNAAEDVRDTAIKLGEIFNDSPTDYFYIKGFIHCLLQKEKQNSKSDQTPKKKHEPQTA